MASSSMTYPFVAFSFSVEITPPGKASLCGAAFAECDGLELGMDIKTIREGGNNLRQIRLAGAAVVGTLTLKRGMTTNYDLWKWASDALTTPGLRYDASVVMTSPLGDSALSIIGRQAGGGNTRAHFLLSNCLPQKLKAPALNAKDGMIAIEELQVVYESLTFMGQS
jgi:phage tail-like protein